MHNNIILDRATQLSLRGGGGGVPRACFRIIAASCSVSTYLASVLLNVFDNMLLIPPHNSRDYLFPLLTSVLFVYKLTSCSVSLISFSNVSNMTWGDSSCLTCWRTGTQSPRALIIYWNKLGWEDIKQGPPPYPVISGQWNRGLILHHVWFKIAKITKHSVLM